MFANQSLADMFTRANAYIIQCSKMLVIYARYHFYVESLVNEMQTKASFEVLELEATIMFIVMFG